MVKCTPFCIPLQFAVMPVAKMGEGERYSVHYDTSYVSFDAALLRTWSSSTKWLVSEPLRVDGHPTAECDPYKLSNNGYIVQFAEQTIETSINHCRVTALSISNCAQLIFNLAGTFQIFAIAD